MGAPKLLFEGNMKKELLIWALVSVFLVSFASASYLNNTVISNVGLNTTINITHPWNFSSMKAVDGQFIFFNNFSQSNPLAVSKETLSWNLTDSDKRYTGLLAPYYSVSNHGKKVVTSAFDGSLGGGVSEIQVSNCDVLALRYLSDAGGHDENFTASDWDCSGHEMKLNISGYEAGKNNLSLEYNCTNMTLGYEPNILEGALTNYTLVNNNANKTLCAISDARLIYNSSVWAPTCTSLGCIFIKSWAMVGVMSNSFYWEYNITYPGGTTFRYNTTNRTQDIEAINIGACDNLTNTTAILLQVINEDYLTAITGANIWGVITYYSPINPAQNKTYSFGGLNYTPGFVLTNTTDLQYFPTSSSYTGDYDTNFRVIEPSIITSYMGACTAITCSGVSIEIYKGACGSVNLLASGIATAVPNYNFIETFGLSNYSEILNPGLDYCIRLEHGGGHSLRYHPATSYLGSIISISSESVGHNNQMKAQTVSTDAIKICMRPAGANFAFDAYLNHEGGANGYIQRWYLKNETVVNGSNSVFMYNFELTNTTKTLTMSLFENSYNTMYNVLAHLLRFYPGENLWRVVQMEETDAAGKANWHIREEDTDYKIRFYQNRVLLRETGTLKFKCPLYADCTLDATILPETPKYKPIFEDIAYWTYPDINSLTALTNETLSLHVTSPPGKVRWFAIYAIYNGTTYKTNLTNATGGWANITIPLKNVTDPLALNVYYKIQHLTKGTFSAYRQYFIYPHASDPSFFKAMVFMGANFSTFWLMMFAALVTIGIIGTVLQFGSFGIAPLAVLTVIILGVFTYFGWFPGGIFVLIVIPILYFALSGLWGNE
jgi:hypothetical protein